MATNRLHALTVEGVRQQEDQESLILTLRDDLDRTFEMTIGRCEARAIQMVLNHRRAARPQTHDLMLVFADRLDAPISRVIIDDFSGDTYFARLILNSPSGPVSLDCRPSDGIALALRANAPILAYDAVIAGSRPADPRTT